MTNRTATEIKKAVRESYGARAREQLAKTEEVPLTPTSSDSCCGPSSCGTTETGEAATSSWADKLYSAEELGTLPEEAAEMSLGCGNPTAIAELNPGESVLDLGSGSGLDCFLAATQVGPKGRVVGLDMTDDMLELARRNLAKVSATNVEFEKGEMESMPLPDSTFDVIISNCVINLSPDKDAVFRESFRVLKPGGRIRVSDIVWTREPTEAEKNDVESWAGCTAGALQLEEYIGKLKAAGFVDIEARFASDAPTLDEQTPSAAGSNGPGIASAYISAKTPD